MPQDQLKLLPDAELPQGFKYSSEVISPGEEQGLLERIRKLPLAEFQFHGFTAKRRVISYGWNYDFEAREVREVEAIPSWLLPLRERAAAFAGILPDQLQQALVMEYDVGAAIGWHRDKAVFGDVIGVSLLSACRFRLRRKVGAKWERASLVADARSAYLLRGPARTEWEHSIPGVDALRYSVTFRSFSEQVRH